MISPAQAHHCKKASELIHQSGPASFDYIFNQHHGTAVKEFLCEQFQGRHTMFSHNLHHVYTQNNQVMGTLGLINQGKHSKSLPYNAWHIFKHYGWRSIYKGLKFEHKLVKPPKKKCLYLYHIAVCNEQQGRGIARKLIEFAEQTAKEQSYPLMSLDVAKHNQRALNLYLGMGFEIKSHQPSYHSKLDDHIYMEKSVI
jgi:hypothetical protein